MEIASGKYRTRCFQPAIVHDFSKQVSNAYPVAGYFRHSDGSWSGASWTQNGRWLKTFTGRGDLVGPWRDGRMTRQEWIECGGDEETFDRYVGSDGMIEVDEAGNILSGAKPDDGWLPKGYRALPVGEEDSPSPGGNCLAFKNGPSNSWWLDAAPSLPGFAGYAYRKKNGEVVICHSSVMYNDDPVLFEEVFPDKLIHRPLVRPFAVVVKE